MQEKNNISILNINEKVNLFDRYEYSIESSMAELKKFIVQVGYVHPTRKKIIENAQKTHKLFPSILWLQKSIDDNGILEVGKGIDPRAGTVYLHFMVLIGLIKMKFSDYYKTNTKTLLKLYKWYEPYYEELGINKLQEEIRSITQNTRNRKLNIKKCEDKSRKTIVYLIMKYHLSSIYELKDKQWNEFILDCRDSKKLSNYNDISNYTNIEIMQKAFLNLGITEEVSTAKQDRKCKERAYENMVFIYPGVDLFIKYCETKYKKGTIIQYKNAIEQFCIFIQTKYGYDVKFSNINRSDINEYMDSLFLEYKNNKFSHHCLQNRALCLKGFLRFASENSKDLKMQGIPTLESKIVIDEDFRTPNIKTLPKPLRQEVLDALLNTLKNIDDKLYILTFLVMLNTGIAKSDVLNLKYDCLKYDENSGEYFLSYLRIKTKTEIQVKVQKEVATYVKKIQEFNTQKVPTIHPDGEKTIFLLNDGGKKIDVSWFKLQTDKHKNITSKHYPHLKNEIEKFTTHRLRHTFATIMREKGADILTLRYLLGHSSIMTTMKYTKESDKRKIELIDSLSSNQYYCEAMPRITGEQINSEEGLVLIENMLRIENKLSIGICTVEGHKNCPMAFKCIDCIYLCSTKEDLPEMINILEEVKAQYDNFMKQVDKKISNNRLKELNIEMEKCKRRIQLLYKKINKIQSFDIPISDDENEIDSGILSFI